MRNYNWLIDVKNILDQIDRAAEDGQNGSSFYALDRLRVIRKLVESVHVKLDRHFPHSALDTPPGAD